MRAFSTRKPPSLPTSTYKDKQISRRPLSTLRLNLLHSITSHPYVVLSPVLLLVLFGLVWSIGLLSFGSGERRRLPKFGEGLKVLARDYSHTIDEIKSGRGGRVINEKGELLIPENRNYNETILILCPMKNSIEHIWHFFQLLDRLSYPSHLLQLGILVSDSSDRTYARALELADERQYSRKYKGKRWSKMTVLNKDFVDTKSLHKEDYKGDNVGKERHAYEAQVGRRTLLAKSRSWLLMSTLSLEVDYVLWLDVDVVDYEPSMIERLLGYAKGEIAVRGERGGADVVVPNCVWKTYNEMGAYDRNNWIETPESLEMQKNLSASSVLLEGYEGHPTHRSNLASLVPSHPSALSSNPYLASTPLLLSSLASLPSSHTQLPSSEVPETLNLDGVGGCAALVKSEVHREGAVFPSWVQRNQVETEGFARLVRDIRGDGKGGDGKGRMVGLPRYYVYHADVAAAAAAAAEVDCGCNVEEYESDRRERPSKSNPFRVGKRLAVPKAKRSRSISNPGESSSTLITAHVPEQAQSTSQARHSSPHLGQLADEATVAGPHAIDTRLMLAMQQEGFGLPSHVEGPPKDGCIDPDLLRLKSLSKRDPPTLRQQVRYRMLYPA
ncbi:hypothetical protein JCM5353_005481 [Sporobolomyces roseus]